MEDYASGRKYWPAGRDTDEQEGRVRPSRSGVPRTAVSDTHREHVKVNTIKPGDLLTKLLLEKDCQFASQMPLAIIMPSSRKALSMEVKLKLGSC